MPALEFRISRPLLSLLYLPNASANWHSGTSQPDAERRPRVLVIPSTAAFGLGRMFQIVGEPTRPLLSVVHTMDEALAAVGIQYPNFEPLE